jgi:GNAT superfamily N-acetyltransferase
MKIVQLTSEYKESLLEIQNLTYEPNFQETSETMNMLLSDNTYNWGLLDDNGRLIGCILCDHSEVSTKKELWLWDISIVPEHQRKGYASLLLIPFFEKTHKANLTIRILCRYTSHSMFTNPENLKKWEYEVEKDSYEKDGYFKVCGVHEDLYEVTLAPCS